MKEASDSCKQTLTWCIQNFERDCSKQNGRFNALFSMDTTVYPSVHQAHLGPLFNRRQGLELCLSPMPLSHLVLHEGKAELGRLRRIYAFAGAQIWEIWEKGSDFFFHQMNHTENLCCLILEWSWRLVGSTIPLSGIGI